ncbi:MULTISPECIES: hypothetical protein [unclassified Methylobacterium]|uniref:hypothetical protein n=1 Tax=unclassified Methylobacterium TaxID=2615210 RepID=UPI00226A3DC0|nr:MULTISPECIES: hypothetical protein [unclassified Methylobacterium]
MLDLAHLLEQADRLAIPLPGEAQARPTDLRRAVSTLYYAVFHAGLTAAADQFAGVPNRGSPLYNLVYRSIDHKRLAGWSRTVSSANLPSNLRPYEPAGGWDQHIRDFGRGLVTLYEQRTLADYDPAALILPTEVANHSNTARQAIADLAASSADCKQAFFTLLLFPPR